MSKIPDLWSNAIDVDVLTPAAILNTQASLLKRKTQGIVIAEVGSSVDSNKIVTITFDLVAPGIDNFRARVLAVRHKAEYVYPALVSTSAFSGKGGGFFGDLKWGGIEDQLSKLAETETEFIGLLQEALRSGFILSMVQSLIARSNEARGQPRSGDLAGDDATASVAS
jgi:hypothetical protein